MVLTSVQVATMFLSQPVALGLLRKILLVKLKGLLKFPVPGDAFDRDRRSKGSLTAADWAIEFLHTEVACKCARHACATG